METRSLSRCNSALVSASSACGHASVMLKKNYVSVLCKISNFPALAPCYYALITTCSIISSPVLLNCGSCVVEFRIASLRRDWCLLSVLSVQFANMRLKNDVMQVLRMF